MIENKKKIFYWSPFISKVATVKAVVNSALSIKKFASTKYEPHIINSVGEWDNSLKELEIKKIKSVNFYNDNKIEKFKTKGFINSRLLYIYIFFKSFFPLLKLIKKNDKSFLIIHLLTSLPLFLNLIFNLNIKIILRISGYPKLNFLRKFFWKIALRKVSFVTCPTEETLESLIKNKIVDRNKLVLLRDPVLNIKEIQKSLGKKDDEDLKRFLGKKFYLAVGRLTKQKNFSFLISCFNEIINYDKNKILLIIGEGESYKELVGLIKKFNLEKNIFLLGYKENIFDYFKACECFILSSLWEDPGFVIVEAAYFGKKILSSNCRSGPKEILRNGKAGVLFENNSKKDFLEQFKFLIKMNNDESFESRLNAKKISKNYSLFSHFKSINNLIS